MRIADLDEERTVIRESCAFGTVAGCLVYVGGPRPPRSEDWAAYLEFLRPLLSTERATPRVIWDDSGGPSAVDRRKLVELTQGYPMKAAIISRGHTVSTVLNWQHDKPAYHDFGPHQLDEAIAFVGFAGPAAVSIRIALRSLRKRLVGDS